MVPNQLVDNLQLVLHIYLKAAFAALEALTTTHRGRLAGSVHTAGTSITDGLKASIETVEVFCGPSASGN